MLCCSPFSPRAGAEQSFRRPRPCSLQRTAVHALISRPAEETRSPHAGLMFRLEVQSAAASLLPPAPDGAWAPSTESVEPWKTSKPRPGKAARQRNGCSRRRGALTRQETGCYKTTEAPERFFRTLELHTTTETAPEPSSAQQLIAENPVILWKSINLKPHTCRG